MHKPVFARWGDTLSATLSGDGDVFQVGFRGGVVPDRQVIRSAVRPCWQQRPGPGRLSGKRGFTLVEALVGALILAVGAVVICGLSRRCIENNVRAGRYEQAYRLLDECLDRVAALAPAELAQRRSIDGDFGSRHVGYRFAVLIEPTESSNLYRATAKVFWQQEDTGYEIEATTLIYPLSQGSVPASVAMSYAD